MSNQTLVVLGAGPKAAAIAAKANLLAKRGFDVPRLVIIESRCVAANWRSEGGLTNGFQPLGTSPEKDVGFPYDSFVWGSRANAEINQAMQEFSWQSFLVFNRQFSSWVDRGRPAPSHERWADYLEWVMAKVGNGVTMIQANVTHLDVQADRWDIRYQSPDGTTSSVQAEGLVVTGPGSTELPPGVPKERQILSVSQFWNGWKEYAGLSGMTFAIVGNGETAASISVILAQNNPGNQIEIINPLAINFTRGESYMENHVYTDPFQGNWFELTMEDRRNFINRTDRGVFSVGTQKILDHCENVSIVPGRCEGLRVDSLGQLVLSIHYNNRREERCYDFAIVAAGFDHWRFVDAMLTDRARNRIADHTFGKPPCPCAIEETIDEHLSVRGLQPMLHLPMMGLLAQGPGFANLSCLGRLSDQVLSAYIERRDHEIFGSLDFV